MQTTKEDELSPRVSSSSFFFIVYIYPLIKLFGGLFDAHTVEGKT